MCSLSVLGVRSPRSRCFQGHISSEGSKERFFPTSSLFLVVLPNLGVPWFSSLSVSSQSNLPVCLVSSINTWVVLNLGPILIQYDLVLANCIYKDSISKQGHIVRSQTYMNFKERYSTHKSQIQKSISHQVIIWGWSRLAKGKVFIHLSIHLFTQQIHTKQ